MRKVVLPLVLAVGFGCLLLARPAALGKLAFVLGGPRPAAVLLGDPAIGGVADYRAGRHTEADAAFATAGRRSTYNRGLSLAVTGNPSLALAYFDAVLFANPADEDARFNRGIVAGLIEPVVGRGNGRGRIAAAGKRVGAADAEEALRLQIADQTSVRRPVDAGVIAANDEWLQTLPDDPGEFLKKRLQAEYDRRTARGLIRPAEANPW